MCGHGAQCLGSSQLACGYYFLCFSCPVSFFLLTGMVYSLCKNGSQGHGGGCWVRKLWTGIFNMFLMGHLSYVNDYMAFFFFKVLKSMMPI